MRMTWVASTRGILVGLALFAGPIAFAADAVYQSPEQFLAQYLPGCLQQSLWLTESDRKEIESLIDRPHSGFRVRYSAAEAKTAWILDEIGKTEPITTGVVVNRGMVERVRVLVFRESRGSEVHREAFVQQYDGARLTEKGQLGRCIDGITGATLSIWAVGRQTRLALFFDQRVRNKVNDS